MISRGIGICTYNRGPNLGKVIDNVVETAPKNCRIVVCDDGSTDDTAIVAGERKDTIYLRGPNQGVAANKNRALFALQDCDFVAILEDDLYPTRPGWFELYENAVYATNIHHFCRVQDKEVEEVVPGFTEWLSKQGATPIYGPSPRGDFTFISSRVISEVGAFNPRFKGAGYAHGEWSNRAVKAGLIPHPLLWIDLKEARDQFVQIGDQEGGRWLDDSKKIRNELKANANLLKDLKKTKYVHHPLVLS